TELNLISVRERFLLQREDGKGMEIDIVAESDCERVVLVDVRKRKVKTTLKDVEDFWEKVETYKLHFPDKKILPAYLSVGDFTGDAKPFCKARGIGMAIKLLRY
ncbi:MAG: hypothetical protein DRQ41_04515, partial [Gammaproteobacteria bacterium]